MKKKYELKYHYSKKRNLLRMSMGWLLLQPHFSLPTPHKISNLPYIPYLNNIKNFKYFSFLSSMSIAPPHLQMG